MRTINPTLKIKCNKKTCGSCTHDAGKYESYAMNPSLCLIYEEQRKWSRDLATIIYQRLPQCLADEKGEQENER